MSTTYAIVLPTTEARALTTVGFDSTISGAFTLVDHSPLNANPLTASYIYNGGAAEDPVVLTLQRVYDQKLDQTRCSMRLSTDVRKTVSETGEVTDTLAEAQIGWTYSGKFPASTTEQIKLLQVAADLVFGAGAGSDGSAVTTILDMFARGVLTDIL